MKIFKSKTFLRHAKCYVNQPIANTTFQCVGCVIFILLPDIFRIQLIFLEKLRKNSDCSQCFTQFQVNVPILYSLKSLSGLSVGFQKMFNMLLAPWT